MNFADLQTQPTSLGDLLARTETIAAAFASPEYAPGPLLNMAMRYLAQAPIRDLWLEQDKVDALMWAFGMLHGERMLAWQIRHSTDTDHRLFWSQASERWTAVRDAGTTPELVAADTTPAPNLGALIPTQPDRWSVNN